MRRIQAASFWRLVANADTVYRDETPTDLADDIVFLDKFCAEIQVALPENLDLNENRRKRRELADRAERSVDVPEAPGKREFRYSEGLSDGDKFHLASRHMEMLGQVIRNFPGSLPGPEKLSILKSTYLLGLRLLRAILHLLQASVVSYQEALAGLTLNSKDEHANAETLKALVDKFIMLLSRVITLGILLKISGCVGVADLEAAYEKTLEEIGSNNATRLVDLTIKLDHSGGFPEKEMLKLHEDLTKSPFADLVLKDLVLNYIQKFGLDYKTRQRITKLLGFDANTATTSLLESSKRK